MGPGSLLGTRARVTLGAAARMLLVVAIAATVIVLDYGPAEAFRVPKTLSEPGTVQAGPVEVDFPIGYVAIAWEARDLDIASHAHEHAPGRESHGAVRFRHDGRWEAWIPFLQDGAEAEGQWTSSLIPAGDAEAYQIRGVPAWARSARAVAINTTDGPMITTGTRPRDAADSLTNCVSRAEWGADESVMLWSPTYFPVQTMVVHHTVTRNDDPDPAATMRAIYHQHAVHNDWGDIAYHYLIDEQGRTYEGRWSGAASTRCDAGGDGSDFAHDDNNKLVTGGHTAYHNQGNLGIALLGNFADESEYNFPPGTEPTGPKSAAVDALTRTLAELAVRHDLDPLGTVDYYNEVWDTRRTVDTISGHRDWRATACPGALLYPQLPEIRDSVFEMINRPEIVVADDPLLLEGNTTGGHTGPPTGVTATSPAGGSVTLTNDAPSPLPFGDTVVTWTATSPTGLSATATQTVRVYAPDPFVDDDNSTFESDIEWMAAAGITKGCNPPKNDRFCPDAVVTRAQMAAFLVRALNLTDRRNDAFVDDDDSIFEADIERLAAAGITKGCNPPTNNRFCPDGKVTRSQMAAFLVRGLGYTDDGGGNLFIDDDGSVFEADIDRLGTAGVTKGCNPPANTRYCPNSFVTRGQMAAFLHRALG